MTIRMGSEKWAKIVSAAVSVDKLVNPDNLQRQIVCQNDIITVHFQATKWKWLR